MVVESSVYYGVCEIGCFQKWFHLNSWKMCSFELNKFLFVLTCSRSDQIPFMNNTHVMVDISKFMLIFHHVLCKSGIFIVNVGFCMFFVSCMKGSSRSADVEFPTIFTSEFIYARVIVIVLFIDGMAVKNFFWILWLVLKATFLIMLGEECNTYSPTLCNFLHSPVISSLSPKYLSKPVYCRHWLHYTTILFWFYTSRLLRISPKTGGWW